MNREQKEATLRLHGWYPAMTKAYNCGWVKEGRIGTFMSKASGLSFSQEPLHTRKIPMEICPLLDNEFETIWFKINHMLGL